jgi:hypothetical protein
VLTNIGTGATWQTLPPVDADGITANVGTNGQ